MDLIIQYRAIVKWPGARLRTVLTFSSAKHCVNCHVTSAPNTELCDARVRGLCHLAHRIGSGYNEANYRNHSGKEEKVPLRLVSSCTRWHQALGHKPESTSNANCPSFYLHRFRSGRLLGLKATAAQSFRIVHTGTWLTSITGNRPLKIISIRSKLSELN